MLDLPIGHEFKAFLVFYQTVNEHSNKLHDLAILQKNIRKIKETVLEDFQIPEQISRLHRL